MLKINELFISLGDNLQCYKVGSNNVTSIYRHGSSNEFQVSKKIDEQKTELINLEINGPYILVSRTIDDTPEITEF